MKTASSFNFGQLLPVLILGVILLFPTLGAIPIMNGDEARFAQAAREMREAGDWVLPSFVGQPRYDKPILIYWATMVSYRLFGETPFAARFPSALAGLCAALFLAAFAGARWGSAQGFKGALLLLASPLIFLEAHACTADALNNLWILTAMLCLLEMLRGNRGTSVRLAFWASIALALLSKGPVVLLVLLGSLAGIQALRRRWKTWELVTGSVLVLAAAFRFGPLLLLPLLILLGLDCVRTHQTHDQDCTWFFKGRHLLWGPLLMLTITLPWALAANHASGGAFFRVAIGHHVIGRSLSTLEHHGGFPGIYILAFFILAFPWAAQLPGVIRRCWVARRDSMETLMLLGWLLGPLLIFECLKTRLVHYEMPMLAAGILLILKDQERTRGSRSLLAFGALLLGAIPLILALYFDLKELSLPALILGALILIPFFILVRTPESRRLRLGMLAATALFLLSLFGLYLPRFSQSWIGPRTLTAINRLDSSGKTFVIYRLRDEELLFNLPLGTRVLRTPDELLEFLQEPRRSILITREKDWNRVDFGSILNPPHPDIRVRGLDLGRGAWVTTLCFRLGSTGPPGADA